MSNVLEAPLLESEVSLPAQRTHGPLRVMAAVAGFLLRAPVTLIHEFGHILVGTVTGGFATGLRMRNAVDAQLSLVHFTLTSRVVTPLAGYPFVSIAAVGLVAAGSTAPDGMWQEAVMAVLGFIGLTCLVLSRNALAVAASAWLVVLAYFGLTSSPAGMAYVGLFVAAIGAVESGRLVILHARDGRTFASDATSAAMGWVHPVVHAVGWHLLNVTVAVLLALSVLG